MCILYKGSVARLSQGRKGKDQGVGEAEALGAGGGFAKGEGRQEKKTGGDKPVTKRPLLCDISKTP